MTDWLFDYQRKLNCYLNVNQTNFHYIKNTFYKINCRIVFMEFICSLLHKITDCTITTKEVRLYIQDVTSLQRIPL